MRTTLDIDDELLLAVKELARQQGTTLGQTVSALAQRSLTEHKTLKLRNGVRLFGSKTGKSTSDMSVVNALRDDA